MLRLSQNQFLRKSRVFLFLLWGWMIGISTNVSAHHVVSELGIAWVKPISVMEFSTEVTAFDVRGMKGHYLSLVPRVEYAFHRYFSLAVRAPLHMVFASGTDDDAGLGDLDVAGKFRVYASKNGEFILSTGMGVEFPTGDEVRGLGSGHFELGPFVTFSSRPVDGFVVVGLLAGRFSLGGHNHADHDHGDDHDHSQHDHGDAGGAHGFSVMSIHSNEELMSRLSLGYAGDQFYGLGGLEMAFKLKKREYLGPMLVRLEGGYLPKKTIRLAVGAEVPFAGENRFDFRARLGMAKFF